jgi:hypothetical protein
MRCGDRTRKYQAICRQRVFIARGQRKKCITRGNRLRGPFGKTLRDIVVLRIHPFYPFQTPFKRPNHAVFGGGGEFTFPIVEDARDQISP